MRRKTVGRTNAKGRNKHDPFVMIRKDIYRSPAFKDLSSHAVRIFLEIRARYNGLNNGEISLSCREAAIVAKCGSATALRSLRELEAHGMIQVAKQGRFTTRMATTWKLTMEVFGSTAPTNEWRDWPQKTEHTSCSETIGAYDETVMPFFKEQTVATVSSQIP